MLSDFCLTFVLKYWSKCSTPSRNSKSKSKNSKIVYFPIKHHFVIDADLSTTTLLEVVSLICETLHYHLNLSNGDDSDSANHVSSLIWTSGLPDGSIVIALICLSVSPSVFKYIKDHSLVFSLCMKLGLIK